VLSDDALFEKATQADLPEIIELEKQAYPFPWAQEAFRNELTKPFSTVVVVRDETNGLVGYIVYWLLFDECHILNVTVAPTRRGQGWGRRLVQYAVRTAVQRHMKRVFLEVRISNTPAIKLYEKLGFFIDHEKTKFYEDGENAYFMVRYLQRQSL
jgi:ribosomal-protein-alanine N-acetyltransferase